MGTNGGAPQNCVRPQFKRRILHAAGRSPSSHINPFRSGEYPRPVIAHRTSPTNVGPSLLSTLAARDFGCNSLRGMAGRIASTLATAEYLERLQGHFYNWYDTLTLKPMQPLYISTVENGNLTGLLLTLSSGLLELEDQNWSAARILTGLRDTLGVLKRISQGAESTAKLETFGNLLNQNPTLLKGKT